MKLKPLQDWAVIVPSEAGARTAGGIYIPDTAKEKPAEGIVESIGPGALEEEKPGRKKEGGKKKERKFIPTTVKPGDCVLYEKYAGQKIAIGNEERVLVRERNILGLLPERPAPVKEDLPPLQIPALTSSPGTTALTKTGTTAIRAGKKAASKPAKKKTAKKAGKRAVKKAVKKSAKKTAKTKPKKSSAKKTSSRKSKKR